MNRWAILPLLLLAGCAGTPNTPEPILRTIPVRTPVLMSCVPVTLSPLPPYPDSDEALRAAVDAAERYLLLFAGREMRAARLSEVEPIVEGCKIP